MESVLSWLGTAGGALVVIAMAVAWWEHLVRFDRRHAPVPPQRPAPMTVDVALDTLVPPDAPTGDSAERRNALDGALGRMVQAGGVSSSVWLETLPMVLQPEGPPGGGPDSEAAAEAAANPH